ALEIGRALAGPLAKPKEAREWLAKADRGGATDSDLLAVWTLADLEEAAGEGEAALRRLAALSKRPLPKDGDWFLQLNYRLAVAHHRAERWKEALEYYKKTASSPRAASFGLNPPPAESAKQIEDYL